MCVKNDYIRIVSELEGLAVEVLTITWSGPYTPEDEWVVAKIIEEPCSAAELEDAIKQV